MKDRIKAVRKSLNNGKGLSRVAFSKTLNLSESTIESYELGRLKPSDRTIADICRVYDINEEWLRNGTGEMKKPKSRNQQIAEFINEVMRDSDESFRNTLIYGLSNLDYEDWLDLERVLNKLANKKEDN